MGRILGGERGAVAAEFALILPGMIIISLGVVNLCVLMFAASTVHFTVENAARWCMINSTTCTSSTVNTFATNHYFGPATNLTFSLSGSPICNGVQVNGQATVAFVTGVSDVSVPISATACHPLGG
jgi:Flp pilus assembly protein TadG